MKNNYQCNLCENIYDNQKAVRMHLFRTHNIRPANESEHYKLTTKGISKPKDKKYDWRKWAKYSDGSRKYKEVNGKLIKQDQGRYFASSVRKSKKQPRNNLPQVLGLAGEPAICTDGIIINLMVKIPFSFGLPTIIPNQE